MNASEIAIEYNNLSGKFKKDFWDKSFVLFESYIAGFALSPPHRLLLDSSIVMRFDDFADGKINESVLSVLFFFDYIKSSNYSPQIFITPTVFYEYCRKTNFLGLVDYWSKFSKLKKIIENNIGNNISIDGIGNFETAREKFDLIEKDSIAIKKQLEIYKNKNWKFQFIKTFEKRTFLQKLVNIFSSSKNEGYAISYVNEKGDRFIPLRVAARSMFQEIKLEYFDPWYVQLFLEEYIAEYLIQYAQRIFDEKSFKELFAKEDLPLKKILFVKNGTLRGVADLEMFSYGNIRHQFDYQTANQSHQATIALTQDRDLFDTLKKYSGYEIRSPEIITGIDCEQEIKVKFEMFSEEYKRVNQGQVRKENISKEISDYIGRQVKSFK